MNQFGMNSGFMPPNYMPQSYNTYSRFQQNNGITWVQGIEGAKAYQLPPNSNTVLMDSEQESTFYIKSSDNVGMCTLRTFTYTELFEKPNKKENLDSSKFVTREEFEEFINNLNGGKNNAKQPVQPANPNKQH